ncbi:MAG TPA: orotate phosphoribosyltransferase [Candidatus Limnocylindria bacterium]|nr:orotate phosphoribosyltransferase [Candidatus Limnocylindria bacterium]
MTEADASLADASVESLFRRSGALLEGHFLLKSGRHAGRYLEKFLVLQHPRFGVEICRRFAEVLAPYSPTLVVGPTTGGVLLSFETARQLGGSVRAAFAEAVPSGGRALRRGWTVGAHERVVIVDDILTTGASLVETVDAVRAAGVEPAAAAVMVDRSTAPIELGFPLHALGRIEIPSWEPDACNLCAAGVPLRKPGTS